MAKASIAIVVGTLVGAGAVWFGQELRGPSLATKAQAQEISLLSDEQNTISIFKNVSPSVVFISTTMKRANFFTLDVTEVPAGSGTGFVWDTAGHIVTNYHVVQGVLEERGGLTVTLADRSTYDGRVVGVDPSKDIAVVLIQAPLVKLHPVSPGVSDALQVGQKVLAIGNPFGLDQTLTTGIVSALGREMQSANNRKIHDMIQTDASINPGNSGGPLLDSRGRVVGMNTAIYSPTGASAGIGFAVPVNMIKRIVPMLIAHGKVLRPGLGINTLNDSVARNNGIEGVAVVRVLEGSAGDKAGLEGIRQGRRGEYIVGDVIVAVGNKKVRSENDLLDALEDYKVGDTVDLMVVRDGRKRKVQAALQRVE